MDAPAIFTSARLVELCPQENSPTLVRIALGIDAYAAEFGVDTILRRAHFIAQIAHESGGFKRMVENLNYSAMRIGEVWPRLAPRAHELAHRPEALANAAYANRLGNGDEASGDGWRYRGRGLVQLTGRENYRTMGMALGLELSANPNQAAEPEIAVRIALTFWRSRNCNDPADMDDVDAVTRLINGGTHGLAERRALTEKAKRIFVTQSAEGLIA